MPPVPNYPSSRRPVGVTLAAVFLGVCSTFLILGGLATALAGVLMKGMVNPAGGNPVLPLPGMMTGILAIGTLFYFVLAGWGIATIVGLVRMRMWARISSIVIGSGLCLVGLIGLAGSLMAVHILATREGDAAANPAALKAILLVYFILWTAIIASGLWLIIYFALRRVGAAFRAAAAIPTQNANYAAFPTQYAAQTAQPHTLGAQTSGAQTLGAQDFYYAQPLDAPNQPIAPGAMAAYPTPAYVPVPRGRPVSIVILAILFLLGGFSQLVVAFMPVPFLFMGIMLVGASAKIVIFLFGALSIYAGISLLKLWKPAWMVGFAIYAVSAVNCILSMIPSNAARLAEASRALTARLTPATPYTAAATANPMQQVFVGAGFYQAMFGFSLLLIVAVLILLWRARWAYKPGALGSV